MNGTLQVDDNNLLLKYLDLLNGEIQKGKSISHRDDGFRSVASHTRSETTV